MESLPVQSQSLFRALSTRRQNADLDDGENEGGVPPSTSELSNVGRLGSPSSWAAPNATVEMNDDSDDSSDMSSSVHTTESETQDESEQEAKS